MEGVKTHMGIIDVFKGERNVIPKQEVKPFRVSQKQWRSSGDSRTNEGRAEMFLYEKQRTIINLDAVKDIFPGREPGALAVSFMSGITSKISVYSSEIEVKKAIEMIAEQMATGKTTVIRVPTAEEVRTRLKNTRLLTEHHATGKKTKGHGGS